MYKYRSGERLKVIATWDTTKRGHTHKLIVMHRDQCASGSYRALVHRRPAGTCRHAGQFLGFPRRRERSTSGHRFKFPRVNVFAS